MALQYKKETVYPEEYIIEEDLAEMGDTNPHTNLNEYLKSLLKWYYRLEGWLTVSNMNLYHQAIRNSQHYIVPNVMLVKIALPPEEEEALTSWDAERQAPAVVFEIASKDTWAHDVKDGSRDKPAIYGRIGVKEYYSYDPHQPQVWTRSNGVRLRGWHYPNGKPVELTRDDQGRLKSKELDSLLLPANRFLRLTDGQGILRLTELEAGREARQLVEQRAAEAERRLAELLKKLKN